MTLETKTKSKFKFKVPSSITLLFFIIIFIMLISWVMKWSGATYKIDETLTLQSVIDDKFSSTIATNGDWKYLLEHLQDKPLPTWFTDNYTGYEITGDELHLTESRVRAAGVMDLFTSIFYGFKSKADIIIFILAIGAFSFIVFESKALESLTQKISKKLGNKTIYAIPIVVIFLSFCGSAYGMCDEAIGFYLIIIPLMLSTGFDTMTGIMMVLLGVGVGPLAATTDPFLISTAVAATNTAVGTDVVFFSDGIAWRLITWVIMTSFTIAYIMIHANKVRKHPQKSVTFAVLEEHKTYFLNETTEEIPLTKKSIAISVLYLVGFLTMVVYMFAWDSVFSSTTMQDTSTWVHRYIPYISSWMKEFGSGDMLDVSGIFLVFSLIVGVMTWSGEDKFTRTMVDGARDMLGVAWVVAAAGAISVMLENTGMKNSLVSVLGKMNGMDPFLFITITYLIFIPASFALPSTSGFSSAIFPIWGPLSNNIKVGATSISMTSGSITAFSYANGWANIFSPASGIVVGALTLGKVDFGTLMKGIWPYLLITAVLSHLLLILGTAVDLSGIHMF